MRWIWLAVALLGLWLAGSLAVIGWVGLREDARRVDVAVVLGNHVFSDGTPSPRLAARLDRAIALYREGLFDRVIVSGGRSTSDAEEAPAMAAYLRAAGVPAEAIVEDPDGANTAATAEFTARWMAANDARSVMVISQYFHLARSRLALSQRGVADIAHAAAFAIGWRDAYAVAREVAALTAYAMRLREGG
jgi:vancomycin permeability regulator SanA